MELRNCINLHFINAIKGNLVTKLRNVNYCGKPALIFKTVKDIIEIEDADRLQPSTSHSSKLEFSCDRVKKEGMHLPFVSRSLWEIDSEGDEFVRHGADSQTSSDSDDNDFGNITLKQLKEKYKPKKRKRANSSGLSPKQGCVKMDPEQDDSDLMEPISSWKLKLPKAKRKRVRADPKSPKVCFSIKSEQNLDSGMEFHKTLKSLIHVKSEVPEPEFIGCQSVSPFLHDSPDIDHNDESSAAEVTSSRNLAIVECRNTTILFAEYQSCTLNEVSYDHLEDVEPISVLLPTCEEINQESNNQQFLDIPTSEVETEEHIEQTSPTKDQSSYMNCCSKSFRQLPNLLGQSTSSPIVPVPVLSIDDCFDNRATTCLTSGNRLVLPEDESALDEPEQARICMNIGEERNSSSEGQDSNIDETPPTSVLAQPPERLLLRRKVISPTSQERICLAMNSTELHQHNNCKGNQWLWKQVEDNALGSDVQHANVAEIPKGSGSVNGPKVIISSTRILKKTKHDRRSSPPKGSLEGPRLPRSLPNLSTGCTSLQGCSESAIAFARRQMQDIESLAMKLTSELKSMQDIVEQKLLFEAYRNISLKNDAEEVKAAIRNAAKVEETSRKWLSMMTRDCNRFCKIMSLKQKGTATATSNKVVQKERKKISFADEAGGKLCHVKLFEDEEKLESIVKQGDQMI